MVYGVFITAFALIWAVIALVAIYKGHRHNEK